MPLSPLVQTVKSAQGIPMRSMLLRNPVMNILRLGCSTLYHLGGGQRPKGTGRHHPLFALRKPWPQNGITPTRCKEFLNASWWYFVGPPPAEGGRRPLVAPPLWGGAAKTSLLPEGF